MDMAAAFTLAPFQTKADAVADFAFGDPSAEEAFGTILLPFNLPGPRVAATLLLFTTSWSPPPR